MGSDPEANPEDLDEDVLQGLKEAGVHRLSLGIQSFEDDVLRWLGRAHTAADACRVLELVTQIGFRKSSVDLILSLPMRHQSVLGESFHGYDGSTSHT